MTIPTHDWSKSFMYAIHQTHFLLEKRLVSRLQQAGRISFSQFLVLIALSCSSNPSQREVADFLFITEATVSRHIEALRAGGYLSRSNNPNSRRSHILTLTEKGRREIKKTQEVLNQELDAVFLPIKDEERKSISTAFERIVNSLQQ